MLKRIGHILVVFLAFSIPACKEESPGFITQMDNKELDKKYLFLKMKISSDTIMHGEDIIIKSYVSNESYKNRYFKHRGMIGILAEKSDDLKAGKSDYYLLDSLNVDDDTLTYIFNTSKLPLHKNFSTIRYLLVTRLYLKNLLTNKDTIYFSSNKEFVVKN